jgi:hypothetical protein
MISEVTGESKGYGLVKYITSEAAAQAKHLLTGKEVGNRTGVLHCYKTEGEIPVHTHDDAGRQRSTTGKYFPYESGVNTCYAPAVF